MGFSHRSNMIENIFLFILQVNLFCLLTPYNRKYNVLSASLNKTLPSCFDLQHTNGVYRHLPMATIVTKIRVFQFRTSYLIYINSNSIFLTSFLFQNEALIHFRLGCIFYFFYFYQFFPNKHVIENIRQV